jgi:hypothetical protein
VPFAFSFENRACPQALTVSRKRGSKLWDFESERNVGCHRFLGEWRHAHVRVESVPGGIRSCDPRGIRRAIVQRLLPGFAFRPVGFTFQQVTAYGRTYFRQSGLRFNSASSLTSRHITVNGCPFVFASSITVRSGTRYRTLNTGTALLGQLRVHDSESRTPDILSAVSTNYWAFCEI